MISRDLCNHLCEGADPGQQDAIKRTCGIAAEPATGEDLEVAAKLLVAAATEGHFWAIQEVGNVFDGEPE